MKYRPSNGTEGEMFMDEFCFQCKFDINEDCEILADTFCYNINDPEYPEEWTYDKNNNPICTKFEKK